MANSIEVHPAPDSSIPAIQKLLQDYLAELGAILDYPWFPLYWKEQERFPYLIFLNEKIAGFLFIRQLSIQDEFEMAEFYVMPEFRGIGAGNAALTKVFSLHPGDWTISVSIENLSGMAFWKKTLSSQPGKITGERTESGRKFFQFRTD